jgi:N-acetylated-alpha-linked acidic dipeptidase
VQQERRLVRSANLIATLRGRDAGERGEPLGPRVIVGCHHDAWGYGASDPTSGLIAVLEVARVLARDAREHGPARRSISFAAWGAEEFGIIGSAEYVEARRAELTRDGVLYVNLDAAANGLSLGVAATPEARALLVGALAQVPQPWRVVPPDDGAGGPRNEAAGAIEYRGSALEAWAPAAAAGTGLAPFGELGGGSDHAPFLALTGIPGVNVSAGGAPGTAYHSIYDDLAWYRSTVGSDYASAQLVARVSAVAASRAADAPWAPVSLSEGPHAVAAHLDRLVPAPEPGPNGTIDEGAAQQRTPAMELV